MAQGHHRGLGVGGKTGQGVIRPVIGQGDAGKAGFAGEGAAWIDDRDIEAGHRGHRRQRLGDVHRADDQQARRRHIDAGEHVAAFVDGAALAVGETGGKRCAVAVRHGRIADDIVGGDQGRGLVRQADHARDGLPGGAFAHQTVEDGGIELFHVHLHAAAAGQSDFPGLLVADTELQQAWLTVADGRQRFLDHRAFDAATGDRAGEFTGFIDGQMAADGAGRRAPGGDDGGQGDALVGVPPPLTLLKDAIEFRCHGNVRF